MRARLGTMTRLLLRQATRVQQALERRERIKESRFRKERERAKMKDPFRPTSRDVFLGHVMDAVMRFMSPEMRATCHEAITEAVRARMNAADSANRVSLDSL